MSRSVSVVDEIGQSPAALIEHGRQVGEGMGCWQS
jgi:hypothetical protein